MQVPILHMAMTHQAVRLFCKDGPIRILSSVEDRKRLRVLQLEDKRSCKSGHKATACSAIALVVQNGWPSAIMGLVSPAGAAVTRRRKRLAYDAYGPIGVMLKKCTCIAGFYVEL